MRVPPVHSSLDNWHKVKIKYETRTLLGYVRDGCDFGKFYSIKEYEGYIGQFRDGKAHGVGIYFCAGTMGPKLFFGRFDNGILYDTAMVHSNGEEIYGEPRVDLDTPFLGIAERPSGDQYWGYLLVNGPMGIGCQQVAAGILCKGTFVKGAMSGDGVQLLNNGSKLEGSFLISSLHGYGVVTTPTVKTEGFFVNGDPDGYIQVTPSQNKRVNLAQFKFGSLVRSSFAAEASAEFTASVQQGEWNLAE